MDLGEIPSLKCVATFREEFLGRGVQIDRHRRGHVDPVHLSPHVIVDVEAPAFKPRRPPGSCVYQLDHASRLVDTTDCPTLAGED